jgi:SAM-dependent methyltransferase
MDLAEHWEELYRRRAPDSVSWYEEEPLLSLQAIAEASSDPARRVIDVGGGSSRLVDRLLDEGVGALAVLDISQTALATSKRRLGERADRVTWIVADITTVRAVGTFDVWHDRAAFHFLTEAEDRRRYVDTVVGTVPIGGHVIIAAFGPEGPDHCSGLPVERYDGRTLAEELGDAFELVRSEAIDHRTPAGATQRFVYSTFRHQEGR